MGASKSATSSRTKWIVLGGIAFLVIATVMAVMLFLSLRSTGLGVVERHSGIDLPDRVSEVDSFEDPGRFVIAHVRVSDPRAFLIQQNFGRAPDLEVFEDHARSLKPNNRVLAEGNEVVGAQGTRDGHFWSARFDPSTGRLWVLVTYPE